MKEVGQRRKVRGQAAVGAMKRKQEQEEDEEVEQPDGRAVEELCLKGGSISSSSERTSRVSRM